MKKYDYHTHNGFSGCARHPYPVAAGWRVARSRGITKYGVSNHIPANPARHEYLPGLRAEIDALGDSRVLLGVELDLDREEGVNYLAPAYWDVVDFALGASHNQPVGFLKLPDIQPDEVAAYFAGFRRVLENSFKKIPLDIWAHPFLQHFKHFGTKYWADFLRPLFLDISEVCANEGVAIELTPAYRRKCGDHEDVFAALEEMYALAMEVPDLLFSLGSDAHRVEDVGDIQVPLSYVEQFAIPDTRIVDLPRKR